VEVKKIVPSKNVKEVWKTGMINIDFNGVAKNIREHISP
jgi:hypothetical protein